MSNTDPKKLHQPTTPPLQIRQYDYGWSVIYFGPDGHVRHLVSTDDEVHAFRAARGVVQTYNISGQMLVHTVRGDYLYSIAKLLAEGHHPEH